MNYRKSEGSINYPGRKILGKMGFLKDQKGIINRYLREQKGWESHLDNTRKFILQCLEEFHPESITVLGSGWLLDFPLEEAYRVCNKIFLWDIYHPPQILRKIKDYPGVKPCYEDITGGLIKEIYHLTREYKRGKESLLLPDPANYRPDILPGSYCVSLNVLNQLDILLVDYIKQFKEFPEKELENFRRSIQAVHLDLLRKNACFISDIEEIAEKFDNEKQESKNLVYTSIPEGKYRQEWTWEFDSSGYYHPNRVTKMRVMAISF